MILIIDCRGQSIDLIGVLKESFWQQDEEIKRVKLVFRSLLYKYMSSLDKRDAKG